MCIRDSLRAIPFLDEMLFTNAAWTVAVATYAGVPIPQAAPFVGVPLKCKSPNKPILDPYADRLFNAIQVMNLGNNRTRWHDTCHCSGGVAEAVLLRRRYAVMKEAARARRR